MSQFGEEKTTVMEGPAQGIVLQEAEISPGCGDCDTSKRIASDAQVSLLIANARIKELEEQVALMTIKATSAGQ